jgi:hypothetical protein
VPNCDFYALAEDCRTVLDFVFAQDGWVLHELASQPDCKVRVFRATDDVFGAFDIGKISTHFQLHAPETGGRVKHRKIVFDAGAVPGATHRYTTEGWGLIQLYLGALRAGTLSSSHTNHNSETRAQTWSATVRTAPGPDAWDWDGVKRVSGKLVRFIRKLGVDKHGSRPILPAAHAAREAGRVRRLQ